MLNQNQWINKGKPNRKIRGSDIDDDLMDYLMDYLMPANSYFRKFLFYSKDDF